MSLARRLCRAGVVGRREYDGHLELAAAVEHMKRIAADDQASVVFVHRVDGTVDALGPD